MEATEKSVSSEHDKQISDEHLTEVQRKVLDALRQMNVHHYCPPARQIAQRLDMHGNTVRAVLKELCKLGLVILRVEQSSGDESYRICGPEEYMNQNQFVVNDGVPVSPKQDLSSTGTVSPKTPDRVSTDSIKKLSPRVLQCPACDFVTRSYSGLSIHQGQMHKTAATVKGKLKNQMKVKRMTPDPPAKGVPLVTIRLTMNEALGTSIVLALEDYAGIERFKDDGHKSANKILGALINQMCQNDLEGTGS